MCIRDRLDEILEPRIVAHDHHAHRLLGQLGEQREVAVGGGEIERALVAHVAAEAAHLGDELRRLDGARGGRGDDEIGEQLGSGDAAAHLAGVALPPFSERSLVVALAAQRGACLLYTSRCV